jgi:hypothetical protein
VILIALGVLFGVPVLWTVSVGAVRDARRARQIDPRSGCQAWVTVRGLGGRRYRCGEPLFAGGPGCRRHESERARDTLQVDPDKADPDAELIDEHQAVGRALAQARIGIPLAIVTVLATLVLIVWTLQRTT